MGGIYTAKAVVPTLPNVPPGWPTDSGCGYPPGTPGRGGWPFPPEVNIQPPGYEPEYSLVGEGPVELEVQELPGAYALEVIFLIVDHGSYPTAPPLPGVIKLSANVEGSVRYFSGGAGLLEYDYETIGNFTGILKTVTVNLLESDVDKDLTILGETTAYWQEGDGDLIRWQMQDTVYIPIKQPAYIKEFSAILTINSWTPPPPEVWNEAIAQLEVRRSPSPYQYDRGRSQVDIVGGVTTWTNTIPLDQISEVDIAVTDGVVTAASTGTIQQSCGYYCSYRVDLFLMENASITAAGTVTWSDGTIESFTDTTIISGNTHRHAYLGVDCEGKTVTWYNWYS